MTKEQMIKWIDEATYEQLLHKWRFAHSGNLFFQGEVGEHYKTVMLKKRDQLDNDEQVRVSKAVGLCPK